MPQMELSTLVYPEHYGNCCFACYLYSVLINILKSLFIFKVFQSDDFFVKNCVTLIIIFMIDLFMKIVL